jgi:hypothetical protein
MNGTKLQVVIMDGQMEMTWDGETVYNGPVLDAVEATRRFRQWSGLGFSEAAAVWKFREELVDA